MASADPTDSVVEFSEPLPPGFQQLLDEPTSHHQHEAAEELAKLNTRLDKYAEQVGHSPVPLPTLDFKFGPGLTTKVGLETLSLIWPWGLFIPGDADFNKYWFFTPKKGSNRYSREWVLGAETGNNHAHSATGELFAFVSPRPIDSSVRSETGIGFVFRPPFRLATYAVEVTVDILGQDRYDVNTSAPAGGKVREFGGLYTVAWEISPFDGSLSLVKPFGFVTVFDQTFENLTGSPINIFRRTGPIRTNMVLEGNKSYLIGVVTAVEIDNGWKMNNNTPMQPLPPGSTWKVWCQIMATIPQVWITPLTISIP
jgi:hypothetical protein